METTRRKVYLASLSPRRRELMALLGIPWELLESPEMDEARFVRNFTGDVRDLPAALAEAKAESVLQSVDHGILVCADTDVIFSGKALGKPVDGDDASRMLGLLAGEWHEVITGLCLCDAESGMKATSREITKVKFSAMSDGEIRRYVATGEPMDKAGAYGIQGSAAPFIERIEGCYFNVVGLPVHLLYTVLAGFGYDFEDGGPEG